MRNEKVRTIKGITFLTLSSSNIDNDLQYYYDNNIDILDINPFVSFSSQNLDFLKEHTNLRGLKVYQAVRFDLSPLYELKNLNTLILDEIKGSFDFSRLNKLEKLDGTWTKKLTFNKLPTSLKELSIFRYNSQTKDLTELPNLPKLEKLCLTQGPITSLNGIQQFKDTIRSVTFQHLRKLETIAPLSVLQLNSIWFDACKKIDKKEFIQLSNVKELENLAFHDCGDFESLSFISKLPKLKTVGFCGATTIMDGDTSPLLKMKSIAFDNRRHYTLDNDDIYMRISANENTEGEPSEDTYQNPTIGFTISKPSEWHFVSVGNVTENLSKIKLENAQYHQAMMQYAQAPLVAIMKYQEPYNDLNPSFRVNVKPMGNLKGSTPVEILSLMIPQFQSAFRDFYIAQGPTSLSISELDAGYLRINYTMVTADGAEFPTTSELWTVIRDDYFFNIGAGTRTDDPENARKEIEEILDSMIIETLN